MNTKIEVIFEMISFLEEEAMRALRLMKGKKAAKKNEIFDSSSYILIRSYKIIKAI